MTLSMQQPIDRALMANEDVLLKQQLPVRVYLELPRSHIK